MTPHRGLPQRPLLRILGLLSQRDPHTTDPESSGPRHDNPEPRCRESFTGKDSLSTKSPQVSYRDRINTPR